MCYNLAMTTEQTLSVEQIDARVAELRANEAKRIKPGKWDATIGDWLYVREGLADGETFERVLFTSGQEAPEDIIL